MSLTVALSKGKLLTGSEALFRRAGLPFPDDPGRRLVVALDGLRFLFVKDMDVPTYVEYGVADCGIAGRDVLLETGSDVYEPLDLGFGRCRLVVARPRGLSGEARSSTLRVATKYPRVAGAHFLERGVSVEVVTPVESFHGFYRYSYIWHFPDGSSSGGTSFCEQAPDGRIRLITVWGGSKHFPIPPSRRT